MARKPMPSVLEEIFNITPPAPSHTANVPQATGKPGRPRTSKTVHQQNSTPVSQQDSVPVSQQNSVPVSQPTGMTVHQQNSTPVSQQDSVPVSQPTGLTARQQDSVPVNQPTGRTVSQQDSVPAHQRTGTPVNQYDSTPVSQQDSVPVHQYTSTPAEHPAIGTMSATGAKEKATYYLSPAVLEALNEALFSLKKDVAKKQRKDLSKSLLVEMILANWLEEYQQNRATSHLQQMVQAWQTE